MIPLGVMAAGRVEATSGNTFELVWNFAGGSADAISNHAGVTGTAIGYTSGVSTIATTSAHPYPDNPVAVATGGARDIAVTVDSAQEWTATEISVQVARGGSSGSRQLWIIGPSGEILAGGEVPAVRPMLTTLTADTLTLPNTGSVRFTVLRTELSTGTLEFDNLTIRGTLS